MRRAFLVVLLATVLLLTPRLLAALNPPDDPSDEVEAVGRPIIGALRKPLAELPQIENFEVIGENPLPNPGSAIARGRNGPIGIAGNCLYVGNRIGHRTGTGPDFGTPPLPPEVLVVDIANPARPQVVGAFTTPLNATSRELRTIPDRNTLIVMNFRADGPESSAVNNYQIYDIRDCRNPILVGTIGLGTSRPHEFFLWKDPDPARAGRLSGVRYRVETVQGQLAERYRVKRPWAKDLWHLCHRVIRKVLSHTVAVCLNVRAGRRPLRFDALAA
jgi:hypothetical protein